MTGDVLEDREEYRRPALDVVADDVRERRDRMLRGFQSREAIVWWALDLCRATLGQLDLDVLRQLGRDMSTTTRSGEAASVAALLVPAARDRELADRAAERFREALAARLIEPATHRAVRMLSVSATEYVDDGRGETSDHDPSRQRATAMRPAVDEEHERQRAVLEALLDGRVTTDPLADSEMYVLEWLDRLDVATDGHMTELDRMAVETSFKQVLTGGRTADERAREVLAARWIVPTCCLSIRRVAVSASEVPDAERLDEEVPYA